MAPLDSRLWEGLEILRVALDTPIIINSGYRCEKHNKKIGGLPNSRHMKGQAADIAIVGGLTFERVFAVLEQIPQFNEGGIGIYPDRKFMHLDTGPNKKRWVQLKQANKDDITWRNYREKLLKLVGRS